MCFVGTAAVELPLSWLCELLKFSHIGEGELPGRESQPVAMPTLFEFLGIKGALQVFVSSLALIAHDVVAQHQGLFGDEQWGFVVADEFVSALALVAKAATAIPSPDQPVGRRFKKVVVIRPSLWSER